MPGVPIPLPPAAVPGTAENKVLAEATIRAIQAASEAVGNVYGRCAQALGRAWDRMFSGGGNEANDAEQPAAKPDREQRPDDVPTGTKPVDEDRRLDREKIHSIKDQIGAGARDWVGIDPEGKIWTNEGGKGANQGPFTDYINRGKGRR
jgi:hypothetical protein